MKDLTGKKFDRFLVIGFSHRKKAMYYWKCICVCGTPRIVLAQHLRNGSSRSCGCRRFESVSLPFGKAAKNRILNTYISNAKKRTLKWALSTIQFDSLIQSPCHYCGLGPTQVSKTASKITGEFIYNGIDRLDNNLGYEISNCVPCCGKCNRSKDTQTPEEYIARCMAVADHCRYWKKG